MKKACAVLLLATITVACGGSGSGNSPTGPTDTIPNVAGNYSGTTTVVFPELGQSASCPSSTSVTQASGGSITIAPLELGGACGGVSFPVGRATIDATGSLGTDAGSYFDTSCGGTYNYTASGGFVGRDLRLLMNYTSTVCFNMDVTINLSRQ